MLRRAVAVVFVVSLLIVGAALVHRSGKPTERKSQLATLSLQDALREEETAGEWETSRERRELSRVMQPLPEGKHRLLYVTDFGDRHQVRVRVFPYSNDGGGEAVLWEAPPGALISYILPAPDLASVLVAWRKTRYDYGSRFTVVTVRNAAALAIDHLGPTEWAYWSDPTHVALLGHAEAGSGTWSESSFDVVAGKLKKLGAGALPDHDAELAFLTRPFRSQLDIFEGLLLGQRLVVPFEPGEADGALVRGVGIPYVPPLARDLPLAHPCAAVAPNGEDIALTTGRSDVSVFILHRFELAKGEYSSRVDDVIPLSDLVQHESVWVSQLQWSGDGQQLLFTETHFHPARFHAPDIGGDFPDPIDWTYLMRMWSREKRQTEAIALGRDGWLLPDPAVEP